MRHKSNKQSQQPPPPQRRIVRTEQNVRPFSYYASQRPRPSTTPSGDIGRSRKAYGEGTVAAGQPKSQKRNRRRMMLWIFVIAVAFIFIQLTTLGSDVRVICEVNGTKTSVCDAHSYEMAAAQALGKNFWNHSKVTIDTAGIAREIQTIHPELESVAVAVPIIGTRPTIYVAVSPPAYTLVSGPSTYTLSQSGYITAATPLAGGTEVRDDSGEPIKVGAALLPASHVRFMQRVQYQLDRAGDHIAYFILPQGNAFELNVQIKGKPFYAKFNFQEDPVQQSGALLAVLSTLGQKTPSQYIDLRVPGRAYYK